MEKFAVTFPVVTDGIHYATGKACADYYSPLTVGKKPCVILAHGWSDRSALPLLKMAGVLASRGKCRGGFITTFSYPPGSLIYPEEGNSPVNG